MENENYICNVLGEMLTELKELRKHNKDQEYELLTVDKLNKETGIGKETLLKIFHSGKLKVIQDTKPFKTIRKEWNKYLEENIDILK